MGFIMAGPRIWETATRLSRTWTSAWMGVDALGEGMGSQREFSRDFDVWGMAFLGNASGGSGR